MRAEDDHFLPPPVIDLLNNVRQPSTHERVEIDVDHSDTESEKAQIPQQQTLQRLLAAANETVAVRSSADILAWRGRIYGDVQEDSVEGLSVSGPNTLSIATTLLTAIDTLHRGQEFKPSQAETGVVVDRPLTAIRGVIHGDRLFQVQVSRALVSIFC